MSEITTWRNPCPHNADERLADVWFYASVQRSRRFRERRGTQTIKRDLQTDPIEKLEKLFDKKEDNSRRPKTDKPHSHRRSSRQGEEIKQEREYKLEELEAIFKIQIPVKRDVVNELFDVLTQNKEAK